MRIDFPSRYYTSRWSADADGVILQAPPRNDPPRPKIGEQKRCQNETNALLVHLQVTYCACQFHFWFLANGV